MTAEIKGGYIVKKKILSCLMTLVMVLTLIPQFGIISEADPVGTGIPEELNITAGWQYNSRASANMQAQSGDPFTAPFDPEISDRSDLGGGMEHMTQIAFTDPAGIARNALDEYSALEFYIKLGDSASVPNTEYLTVDILQSLDKTGWVGSGDRPQFKVPMADVKTGWVKVNVPLASFTAFTGSAKIYCFMFRFSGFTLTSGEYPDLYVSEILAVNPEAINITQGWTGAGTSGSRMTATGVNGTNIVQQPYLAGYNATGNRITYTGSLSKALLSGYSALEFYIKLSNPGVGSAGSLDVRLCMNGLGDSSNIGGANSRVRSFGILKADTADWYKVIIPLNEIYGYSSASTISSLMFDFYDFSTDTAPAGSTIYYISDILAVKSAELNMTRWLSLPSGITRLTATGISGTNIPGRPWLGGAVRTGSNRIQLGDETTNNSGWRRTLKSTLDSNGYQSLEFYIHISDTSVVSGADYMNLRIASAFNDGTGWKPGSSERLVVEKISTAAAIAGWVKVVVPLVNLPGYNTATAFSAFMIDILKQDNSSVTPGGSFTYSISDFLAVKYLPEPGKYAEKINLSQSAQNSISPDISSISTAIPAGTIDLDDPALGGWRIPATASEGRLRYYADFHWSNSFLTNTLKNFHALEFYVRTDSLALNPSTLRVPMRVGFEINKASGGSFFDWAVIDTVNLSEINTGWVKVVVPIEKFTHIQAGLGYSYRLWFMIENKVMTTAADLYISDIYAVKYTEYSMENQINEVTRLTEAPQAENMTEFELDIDYDKSKNPFDPAQISLDAVFTSPSGKMYNVPGFYYQDYEYQANGSVTNELGKSVGDSAFRIRYTPQETGTYNYTFTFKVNNAVTDTKTGTFSAAADSTGKKGFIKVEETQNRNFTYEDGTPYIPVGMNVAWPEPDKNKPYSAYQYYKDTIGKMSGYDANYIRIWMGQNTFSLYDVLNKEGAPSGSDSYWLRSNATPDNFINRMDHAYMLDGIMKELEDAEMRVALTLWSFSFFKSAVPDNSWGVSPFTSLTGGYLEDAEDFFTNEEAIADAKIYARYVVARYGYSQSLFTYELFNEIDKTDAGENSPGDVLAWQGRMADYIRSIDPYRNMVSSSTAGGIMEQLKGSGFTGWDTWTQQPASINYPLMTDSKLDFINVHMYHFRHNEIIPRVQKYMYETFEKPILFSEFGYHGDGIDSGMNNGSTSNNHKDPGFISFSQGLWSGMMSGSGTAMSWFWEEIDAKNMYARFKPVADFSKLIPWFDSDLEAVGSTDYTVTNGNAAQGLTPLGYQGSDYAYLWIKNNGVKYSFNPSNNAEINKSISGASIKPTGLTNGSYTAKWVNTYTGALISESNVIVAGGTVTLAVPNFQNDVALALTRRFIKGDLNGDGSVDGSDIDILSKFLLNEIPFTEDQKAAANIKNYGDIDIIDLLELKKMII